MKTTTDPRFTRAVLLHQFLEPFASRGGDIGAILRKNAIPEVALSDPNQLIVVSSLYSAMEDMADALDDPYFCADLARSAALRGVPTLQESASGVAKLDDFLVGAILETGRRVDNVAYALNVTTDAAVFNIRRTRLTAQPTPQADATLVVFYVTLFRIGLGKVFDPGRILVSAPSFDAVPPDVVPRQATALSSDIAFSITFPPEWLSATFQLNWSADGIERNHPYSSEHMHVPLANIREVISNNITDREFGLSELAAICGTSRRRLQRMFTAHGASFRTIRDGIRKETAIDLVTTTGLPLKDVAWKTGFASEATFNRSYRRWTGETPGAHRRRVRSGPKE